MITDYVLIFSGDGAGSLPGRVVEALQDLRPNLLWLDYSARQNISARYLPSGELLLCVDGVTYLRPACCWFRFKLQVGSAGIGSPDECVRIMEWAAISRGLAMIHQDVAINGTANVLAAESKPYQLMLARQSGFCVPETVIGFGKESVAPFVEGADPVVMKAMGYPIIPQPDLPDGRTSLITTPVDPARFADAPEEAFFNNPILYQKRIRHGSEYRVIAFVDKVFCYRLADDVSRRRIADARVLPRRYELEPASERLSTLCADYLDRAGLNYGVFDLFHDREDPAENWHFLECNPEGQFVSAFDLNFSQTAAHLAGLIRSRFERERAKRRSAHVEGVAS